MRVVAVIPAKMTSRRLPEKNMADLCGQPVLYYSIEVAKQATLVDQVLVSSESDSVLDFAQTMGVSTVKRPEELTLPDVTNRDVLKHALAQVNDPIDLVVLLQPTHPLRFPKQLDEAIRAMQERPEFDCLFTVIPSEEMRGEIKNGEYHPEFPLPRQKDKEPKLYTNTGIFYIFRPERTIFGEKYFGEKIYPFVIDRNPFDIDIDYPSDLKRARFTLQSHASDFKHFDFKVDSE